MFCPKTMFSLKFVNSPSSTAILSILVVTFRWKIFLRTHLKYRTPFPEVQLMEICSKGINKLCVAFADAN